MSTKVCTMCGEEKPIDAFSFSDKTKGVRRASCKACHSAAVKKKYCENKERLNAFKETLACARCGYNTCKEALEFHHIDSSKKINSVARLAVHSNISAAEKEMKKCIVLCANCHRELHFNMKFSNITIEEFLKDIDSQMVKW